MLDRRRFKKILKPQISKGLRESAQILENEYKQAIDKGNFARNKPLTIAVKGRDHPLLDTGKMRNAITSRQPQWNMAWVGIPKSDPAFKVARIVSEGAQIEITDRMRAMFRVLWIASMAARGEVPSSSVPLRGRAAELFSRFQDWGPLPPRRRTIRIPPRPFIQRTFKKKAIRRKLNRRMEKAVVEAWRIHVRTAKGR